MQRYIITDTEDLKKFYENVRIRTTGNKAENIGYYANLPSVLNMFLTYNYVKADKSSIHGTGLFATHDIPKGKIITFYPANVIVLYDDKGSKILSETLYGKNTELYKKTYKKYGDLYTLGGESKYYGQYGLKSDPLLKTNRMYLGHLLNDGIGNLFSGISYEELSTNKELSNKIFGEYANFDKYVNSDLSLLDDLGVGYITTSRDIKKGEEILTFYGIDYWYGLEYQNRGDYKKDINYFKSLFENKNKK